MPQVPEYNPAPTQNLQPIGTPTVHVDTPPAAFGANIAQAEQGLGQTLGQIGDEQFKTAMALKTLDNDADARNRGVVVAQQMGDARDKFMSLRGVDAKNGLKDYQANVMSIRQAALDASPNPMVRKMLDQELSSRVTRDLDFAGNHSAQEFQRYLTDTSKSHIKQLELDYGDHMNDPQQSKKILDEMQTEFEHLKGLAGMDPDSARVAYEETTSRAVLNRVSNLAKISPDTNAAKDFLAEAIKRDLIHGEFIEQARVKVQAGLLTNGAANIARTVNSGSDLHWGSSVVSMPNAKNAIGTYESGNNYGLTGKETKTMGHALGKYQVMSKNLPDWLKQSGLPPMTEQEFLKNHDAQDKVFETIFGGYMQKYGSFNEAASRWFSGRSIAEATAAGAHDLNQTTVPTYLKQTNAVLAKGVSLENKVAYAGKLAEPLEGDAPSIGEHVTQQVEAWHNRDRRVELDDRWQTKMTVWKGVIDDSGAGKPTTVAELKAKSPEIADAVDHMIDKQPDQAKSMLAALAANSKGDHGWTTEGLEEYKRLKGMAQDNPAQFLDEDVIHKKLPMAARKEFINLQFKLKERAEADPRVTKAMNMLNQMGVLKDADLTKGSDEYFQFVGGLQGELEQFASDNKRPPKDEETRVLAARLLQEHSIKQAGWWFVHNMPLYQVPVPEDWAEKTKKDPAWEELGIVPSPRMIQQLYTRKLYNDLYPAKGGTVTAKGRLGAPVFND